MVIKTSYVHKASKILPIREETLGISHRFNGGRSASKMAIQPDSKIFVVGSGVFGISTALWLARSGYRDVTVFDMQDTYASGYDPAAGVDSASADINKIIRFSYGNEIEYQRLAFEAAKLWEEWNREIAASSSSELPEVLRSGDRKLWWNCGYIRMSAENHYEPFELSTLENMKKEGIRDTQFMADDEEGRNPLPPSLSPSPSPNHGQNADAEY